MKILKSILAFLVAVVVTHVLMSATGTQFVLADVASFGLNVSFADRMAATVHDIRGLVPMVPMVIGATFLIAFIVAALCSRFVGGSRVYWYLAAGFTSVPLAMIVIKKVLGGTMYAPAGTGFGLFVIGLCGLAGGYAFARMTSWREV